MGRDYTCAQVEGLVHKLIRLVPQLMIGTDVIVGFPGETERDFEATRLFLEALPVHYFHVFSYSDRERARSRKFRNAVPAQEIDRRSKVLHALSEDKRNAFFQGLLGTEQAVLFEQKKNEHWIGHTDNYVTIKMLSSKPLKNVLMPVILRNIDGGSVLATPNGPLDYDGPDLQDQRPYRGSEFGEL